MARRLRFPKRAVVGLFLLVACTGPAKAPEADTTVGEHAPSGIVTKADVRAMLFGTDATEICTGIVQAGFIERVGENVVPAKQARLACKCIHETGTWNLREAGYEDPVLHNAIWQTLAYFMNGQHPLATGLPEGEDLYLDYIDTQLEDDFGMSPDQFSQMMSDVGDQASKMNADTVFEFLPDMPSCVQAATQFTLLTPDWNPETGAIGAHEELARQYLKFDPHIRLSQVDAILLTEPAGESFICPCVTGEPRDPRPSLKEAKLNALARDRVFLEIESRLAGLPGEEIEIAKRLATLASYISAVGQTAEWDDVAAYVSKMQPQTGWTDAQLIRVSQPFAKGDLEWVFEPVLSHEKLKSYLREDEVKGTETGEAATGAP